MLKLNEISSKRRAFITGVLILIAYGVLVSVITQIKVFVMLADVISGLAVIGIAILLFPILRIYDKLLSASYLYLKLFEGILMIIGGVLFLFDSQQVLRDWIYDGAHLYAFIASGFIFYYLLYISKIIPRFVAIWGELGILSLLVMTVLKLLGQEYPTLNALLLLIITNEVFLAIWLMVKGFNPAAMAPVSQTINPNRE
jgi:hypothetical protein